MQDTDCLAKSYAAPRPPGSRNRVGVHRLSPLTQALDLKDKAFADALSNETPVHIRAALMRAWADLQEIAMALRGQGKPKPVEARNATPKRKARTPIAPVSRALPVTQQVQANDATSSAPVSPQAPAQGEQGQ